MEITVLVSRNARDALFLTGGGPKRLLLVHAEW